MHAVPDLIRYFTGDWQLVRRIWDQRALLPGRLTGQATFVATAGQLAYQESGQMIFGDHQGPASQHYDWEIVAPGRAIIRFADGRHFHDLDLTRGLATIAHDCSPDLYRGRFRVIDADCWCAVWQVQGPRKDLILASRFRRLGSADKPGVSWPPA